MAYSTPILESSRFPLIQLHQYFERYRILASAHCAATSNVRLPAGLVRCQGTRCCASATCRPRTRGPRGEVWTPRSNDEKIPPNTQRRRSSRCASTATEGSENRLTVQDQPWTQGARSLDGARVTVAKLGSVTDKTTFITGVLNSVTFNTEHERLWHTNKEPLQSVRPTTIEGEEGGHGRHSTLQATPTGDPMRVGG
jgi:hypothetical protein